MFRFSIGAILALAGAAWLGYVVYAVMVAFDLYAMFDMLQRQPQPAWYILVHAAPFLLFGLALIAGGLVLIRRAPKR